MKKKIIIGFWAFCAIFSFVSCEKESEGLTQTSLLCELNLLGGSSVSSPIGVTFTDPGYTAFEDKTDVRDKVKVTGGVNIHKQGVNTLIYTVTNKDGIPTIKKRTVVVSDKSRFDGTFFGTSYWDYYPEDGTFYDAPITITSLGYGFYEIDDLIGGLINYGWYPGMAGYDFKPEATLRLKDDNTVILMDLGSWYYSAWPIVLTSGSFDPANGKVVLNLTMRGERLDVTLTK